MIEDTDNVEWDKERIEYEESLIASAQLLFNFMGCSAFSSPIMGGKYTLKVCLESPPE